MVHFFSEEISFQLKKQKKIREWLYSIIEKEACDLKTLNYIFCDDNYLHRINQKYLLHDTLTDVITFYYTTDHKVIEGDVYISIERVKENAALYQESFLQELYRVMIHGLLHLIGYQDKTKQQKKVMMQKEKEYICLLTSNH